MKRFKRTAIVVSTAIGAALAGGFLSGCASGAVRTSAVSEGVTKVDLGGAAVTVLNDGAVSRQLDAAFVRNAPLPDVQAELQAMGWPTDKLSVPYNPLVVATGKEVVLIDAGNGEFGQPGTGKLFENLIKAGYDAKAITAVVISHFHGDHINGLRNKAGEFAFPNAKVYVPAPEWNWWMDDARMASVPEAARGGYNTARRVFGPIADKVVRFEPGAEVLPGLRSVAAYGHTPGHTAFVVEGRKQKLLFWADATNISLFVRKPDWAVMFDMDPAAAAASRKRLFEMAAKEKMLVSGYHLHGSAIGTLSPRADAYDFTPFF